MLKTYTLLTFIIISLSTPLIPFASPQAPDYIIFKGDTTATYNLILEQFLQNHGNSDQGRLFGLSFRNGATVNCWRGYQAIYKVDNDSLFLVAITGFHEKREGKIDKEVSLNRMVSIFGHNMINDRVFINWFSGDINFPLANSKILRWDGVFYTVYEKEKVIGISRGKILRIEDVVNYEDSPGSINRRDKSKIPDILFAELKKVKWKSIDKCDCSEDYLVTIGKEGKVTKVIMTDYQSPDTIAVYWNKHEYNYCINTAYKAFRKLKFDLIKDKGKPCSENIRIEIQFDFKTGKIKDQLRW